MKLKATPFMGFFFILVALLLSCSPETPTRPNILFLFASDWGRYASIYKKIENHASINQVLKTPHIDCIARQGALFRNAYVNAPRYTPFRGTLGTLNKGPF